MSTDTPEPTGNKPPKGKAIFRVAGPDDPIYAGGLTISSASSPETAPAKGEELDLEDHSEERT